MFRKPCVTSARASRRTSSTVSVTRRIGLSRENPQYLQLLMHSLERYSGANRRITLPKRCSARTCARLPINSSNSLAAGEIRHAKSASDNLDLPRASRAALAEEVRDRFTSASSGRELNSETELTT